MGYLPDDQVERGSLRQGDVIGRVHLLGAINLSLLEYASTQGKANPTSCIFPEPVFGPGVVLSHSCEIDRSNSIKLTSIIIAPLRDIHNAAPPDKLSALRASNDIEAANPAASFLKYFFLDPLPSIGFSDGSVVDFSKCFSLHKTCYDTLVSTKVAQLDQHTVSALALKLALFFRR